MKPQTNSEIKGSKDEAPRNHFSAPEQPAGSHEGSPVGSRGDHRRRRSGKDTMGGSRTSKK